MNSDLLDRMLKMDVGAAVQYVTDVLRNPTQNVMVFTLVMGAFLIVTLVIVLILVLVFISGSDEDDDDLEVDNKLGSAPVVEAEPATAAPLTPEEVQARRVRRYVSGLVWLLVFAAVWVVGGTVSRQDSLCLACHGNAIHKLRVDGAKGDPHDGTKCVSCHETPNMVASVTTAVPGRAIHFVAGITFESQAANYGTPVKNSSCSPCHEQAITGVHVNDERGLRMSHAEPLAARALCTDCHVPTAPNGVVNRYTVGMDPCLRCHDNTKASAECTLCHTKDVGYAVQSRGTFVPVRHDSELDCGGCHSQKTCDACHQIRMPHTTAFMGAGHARAGVEDLWYNGGRVCNRCHTATRRPCTKCHNTMPSHGVDYMPKGHQSADPFNNGCDQCHVNNAWIKGRNYCGLCHPKWAKYVSKTRQ